MKAITLVLAALAISPFAPAANVAAEKVRFAPQEGSSLTKTFESKAALTLDSMTIRGAGGQTPDIEMTMTLRQKVVVTDTYVKNRPDAPQKLVRSFEELGGDQTASMHVEAMGQSQSQDQNMRAKSAFEGKKVVFTWDEDDEEYKKAYEPEADEKDLEGLDEDMDLRSLLPPKEIAEGDEWELPMSGLRSIFAPGGNLALVPESSDEDSMQMGLEPGSMSEMIGEKLEGTAKARLAKIEEIDGVRIARIQLELDVKSSADMTELAQSKMEGAETQGVEIDHLDVEFGFVGEGELLWDIAGGHFRDLDMSGQMSIKTDTGMSVEMGGRRMEIEQSMSFSGSTTYTARAR